MDEHQSEDFSQPNDEQRIQSACRFLEDHLDGDPPLDEVARAAHYSAFHFHRLFRGLTGETVRGYARRLRLERAAHRLTHSDVDISEIALGSGYSSHEAFTRAFTKHFDITPSEYRAAKQDSRPPMASSDAPLIDVRIESREPCTVACVRHVGPYGDVGLAWKTLMKWGWMKMVFGKAQAFGLCYDDPDVTEPQRVRYDACIAVEAGTRTNRTVELQSHQGGPYAVTLHRGPYATIGETYASLFAHIVTKPIGGKRWRLGDPPSLENYLNDPRKTKPEDLRTEIWMPILSKRS